VIVHKGNESMQIGVEWNDSLPKEPQQAQLEAFVALLKAGRSDYEVVPDIQQWRWKVGLLSFPPFESISLISPRPFPENHLVRMSLRPVGLLIVLLTLVVLVGTPSGTL
jgi:hypothetical protein